MPLLRTLITIAILLVVGMVGSAQTNHALHTTLKPKFTDVPDKKWDKKRIDAWLKDTSGNIYEGQLFYVTDSSLVFFASDTSFYHSPDTSRLGYFHKNEIDRLVLRRDWKIIEPLIGGVLAPLIPVAVLFVELADNTDYALIWGLLFGPVIYVAVATITVPTSLLLGSLWWVGFDHTFGAGDWQEIYPHLEKYALADDEKVPPQSDFTVMEILSNDSVMPKQPRYLFDQMEYTRLSISGGIDMGYNPAHAQFKDHLANVLPVLIYYERQTDPQINFELSGRLDPNWSIHAGGQNASGFIQFDYPGGANEYSGWYDFSYDITRFYLGGSYIVNPVRRLMVHRTQFTLSAGVYSTVMLNWINAGLPTSIDNYDPPKYEYDAENVYSEGMYFQTEYDVFFLKFLSIAATMRYNHGNGLIIKDLKWLEQGANEPTTIRPVKLDNYSLYFGLKVKYHLF